MDLKSDVAISHSYQFINSHQKIHSYYEKLYANKLDNLKERQFPRYSHTTKTQTGKNRKFEQTHNQERN